MSTSKHHLNRGKSGHQHCFASTEKPSDRPPLHKGRLAKQPTHAHNIAHICRMFTGFLPSICFQRPHPPIVQHRALAELNFGQIALPLSLVSSVVIESSSCHNGQTHCMHQEVFQSHWCMTTQIESKFTRYCNPHG